MNVFNVHPKCNVCKSDLRCVFFECHVFFCDQKMVRNQVFWIERDHDENGYDNDADIGIVKPFGAKDFYNVPIEQ